MSKADTLVITAARRTPIGSFLGTLADVSAVDLGVTATRAILEGVNPDEVADVIVGNVLQAGQGMNVARQIAIKSGLPQHVPGQTVNRVCGSGLQAVVSAVQGLKSGDGQLYLAGGTESMSGAPFLLPRARQGYRLGHAQAIDSILSDGLTDVFHDVHMGITAENIAEDWNLSREEQDAFAVESQRRAAAAIESGAFVDEVVPVEVPGKKGPTLFEKDEYVRPGTTAETLAKLKPAFKKGGTVTAGNASGLNDGAAMLAVTTEGYAQANGLPILAEITSYAAIGVDPRIMGIGPAKAVPVALERAGMGVGDVDLFELNEAFAAQSLAVVRDLGVDPAQVNVTGGAIALGHPIGASGARVLVTLIHALRRSGKETGVASLCIGGGMGIAMVVRARS
ncbi:acetyl-CoA C-acetyltransferase [Deinococcus sp. HSC-46F16]|uniref:acetyl-CoA C-acetyltransferase n=1 Tax=Deinococcus sp. HSC-46F16 TaxID=2910968 RepID=UPI00209E6BEA|nr:acetyl-CoA C-acetyltransferase [Deinococcus sp. HSC-46F16]MCP2014740.1 acetyl-CoA C-acetyltransferase [Deinococcus sp. HSC-46F16]